MQPKKIYRLAGSFALISLLISVSFMTYTSTSAAPVSAATATLTFNPDADAYVIATSPDTNYGTSTSLRVDSSPITRSYIRFTVSGLNGAAVQSAKLRIYANSSNSTGYTVSTEADNTWGETTITYNNSPAVGSALGVSPAVVSGAWTEVDVTSYIQADGTYDLALTTTSSTNTNLASRESGADAPQLVITTGSTGSTSTPTATTASTQASTPTRTSTPNPQNTNTPTPTATSSQGQNITFTPDADTYVSSKNKNTNYGGSSSLHVDASPIVNSYLRFTIQGLGGKGISQVQLRLRATNSSSNGINVHNVADNTWKETTLTYNNAPPLGSTIVSSPAVSSGIWVSVDVTSYVTGQGTFSFGVSTPGSTGIDFDSRESGTNAPQLVVTLSSSSTPVPTSTFTPVHTATPTPARTNTPTATSAITSTPTKTSTPAATPSGSIQHVFVVVMENHSYNEVWNTSSSPYITSLGNSYARATNYHAIGHPSLPNYLEMYGGSNFGITSDCNPSSSCHANVTNLADNLDAKGLTWKGYMESMPSPCYLTISGTYAPKHNPFVYFDDIYTNKTRCDAHDVPYTALASDLASAATTPNYSMIVPNQCNDMHDCSVSTGDTWLKNNLPPILNSPACTVDKCLVMLLWDEDDGSQGNQVLTIFAGSGAKTGGVTSSASYNHYSLLRTVEDIFGLPTQTSNDAAASPMNDMLR